MEAKFVTREEIKPSIWQYSFIANQKIDFIPGQYADIHLKNVQNDPRGASRTFSFISLPCEEIVTIILKHFDMQSPYKNALMSLKHGDSVKIDNPMGDLVLPLSTKTPLVFIAGGIGIASFIGMFKELLAKKEEREIYFFYQLRDRKEQIFKDLTERYPLELRQILVKPNAVTVQDVLASTPPEALIYLSGAQGFVENLQKELETSGIPRQQIIFDYYDGYSEL